MTTSAQVAIDRLSSETLLVPIIGTSPLICHKFSEKAKRQMLDNMQGRKTPKQPKDPQADYESSLYRLKDDVYGFPILAFKSSMVGAARFYGKDVKMTELRQFVFMRGEIGEDNIGLAIIDGEPGTRGVPRMREDVVRIGQGTDLRYRGEFWPWSTTLTVTYVTSALQRASVLSLIDAAGLGVGVGEYRVEKRGEYGCYQIDPDRQIDPERAAVAK